MWKLLQILFIGHTHKYAVHEEIPFEVSKGCMVVETGQIIVLHCVKCGKIKQTNIKSPR